MEDNSLKKKKNETEKTKRMKTPNTSEENVSLHGWNKTEELMHTTVLRKGVEMKRLWGGFEKAGEGRSIGII